MLVIHIIAMVSTTLAAIVKAFLLASNRLDTFRKVHRTTSNPVKALLIIGIATGIYIVVTRFGGIVPPWLIIKLGLFITGGLIVVQAEKRENKAWLVIGALLLLAAYAQANLKFS